MGLNLVRKYSINFDLASRNTKFIKFIIIHYTGMKIESDAIKKLSNPKSKLSTHYFIKNDGKILSMVPDNYTAWHAGKSHWKNFNSLNRYSIGIEISNPGHNHGYKEFSYRQISSLVKLLKKLSKTYGIKKTNILGHSDIAPNRKKDPGEKFPWRILAKKNLSYWHELNKKKAKYLRGIKISSVHERIFFKNLYKLGYCRIKKVNLLKNKKYLLEAFQRRFRQDLINGKLDKECFFISKSLLKI